MDLLQKFSKVPTQCPWSWYITFWKSWTSWWTEWANWPPVKSSSFSSSSSPAPSFLSNLSLCTYLKNAYKAGVTALYTYWTEDISAELGICRFFRKQENRGKQSSMIISGSTIGQSGWNFPFMYLGHKKNDNSCIKFSFDHSNEQRWACVFKFQRPSRGEPSAKKSVVLLSLRSSSSSARSSAPPWETWQRTEPTEGRLGCPGLAAAVSSAALCRCWGPDCILLYLHACKTLN